MKLEGHSGASNYAVGCGTGNTEALAGFELSQVLIDCNYPNTSGVGAGAVDVNGSHIHIHDLRIVNFGAASAVGLTVLRACRVTSSQANVMNVVVSNCIFEAPHASSAGDVSLIGMYGSGTQYFHKSCVIRGCVIDCGSPDPIFSAFSVNGGFGTVIEQNQIWNCKHGLHQKNGPSVRIKDIIFRDNYLYNVNAPIELDVTTSTIKVDRITITGNRIDLPIGYGTTGILLAGSNSSDRNFTQVIIRGNQIRHLDGEAGSNATYGIALDCITNGIVEENLINIGNPTPSQTDIYKGIIRTDYATIKTFNNQTTAGKFLPCTNGSVQDPDMVKEMDNWLIAV